MKDLSIALYRSNRRVLNFPQLQAEADQLKTEASKEKKLRERSDSYVRELELELETLRRQSLRRSLSSAGEEAEKLTAAEAAAEAAEADVKRLRTELDRLRDENERQASEWNEELRGCQVTCQRVAVQRFFELSVIKCVINHV